MIIAWSQAILYDPPIVLGRKLTAFSPFHALVLDAIGSPLVAGGEYTRDDLVLAVHVCAARWDSRLTLFADEDALAEWGKEQARCDWEAERAAFDLYMRESWTVPERWQTGKDGVAQANGAYHLAVFGMRRLGLSEAEAWNCPVARIICYREAFVEQETGKSDLIGEDIEKAKAANGAG